LSDRLRAHSTRGPVLRRSSRLKAQCNLSEIRALIGGARRFLANSSPYWSPRQPSPAAACRARLIAALVKPSGSCQRSLCRAHGRPGGAQLDHAHKNHRQSPAQGNITVRVCRNETSVAPCSVAATLQLAPGADATFTDTLPAPLACWPAARAHLLCRTRQSQSRSAGLSNGAVVLAGEAPPQSKTLPRRCAKKACCCAGRPLRRIIARRRPSRPQAAYAACEKIGSGPLGPARRASRANPPCRAFRPSDRALDTSIRFGETYEYRAQRVARVTVGGSTLELAGPLSLPLRIDAVNVFPPSAPKGLAAVATAGENGSGPAIDLSWLPGIEADLAGYIVYRRDSAATDSNWQRISPAQPVVGPGYHDPMCSPATLTLTPSLPSTRTATRALAQSKPPTLFPGP
jgi:hypothetical protein